MMATPDKPRACQTCGFTDTRECDGRHDALTCLRHVVGQRDTLTHRAEAAEAKVREYDSWVCWETNCGHMAKALDMIYSAEASNDAANDAAALWRERCNKAEQKADVLTAELRRLYAAVCRGQTRSDDARAIAQAVIDEYVQTAEQCDRNDTLRADRDAARFLAAGWRRLAETVAAHRWVAQHSLTLSDSLRSQLDDSEARVADLRAKLARAEGVVQYVKRLRAAVNMSEYEAAEAGIRAALATYEEG